ncbi:GTPase IMAP family member 9-like [Misgurnus anguillicaudatus]|uniref:GTPase IMAP family member 9-like n=1 Tax=Misgurnus anguillicaudatus TaxID=75329 RepID=UPI003CCF2630
MGNRRSGKSSSGNIILNREEFDLKTSAQCVKRQREVADRHITVIEAPGWRINKPVEKNTELLKEEILLSVSLCPPGPHIVLLVICVDRTFKDVERKALQSYVDLLGKRVWSHTIVLFTHGDFLGDTSIEKHIESEGEDLQWLVKKCGNRYHLLNNNNRSDETQIKDLLEKIEETVTENNGCCFESDRKRAEGERARSQIMAEDEMSDTVSEMSSAYGSLRSLSVRGDEMSDTVSVMTSGFGSSISLAASTCSEDRFISFTDGSSHSTSEPEEHLGTKRTKNPARILTLSGKQNK